MMRDHYAAIYYASSSEGLARDVQSLLLRIGINARLSKVSQGTKGRDQFHVTLSGNSEMLAFLSIVGTVGKEKVAHKGLILNFLQMSEGKTNRDVIPSDVWALHARPAMAAVAMTQRTMQARLGMSYMGSTIFGQNLSRARARRVAAAVGSPEIELLSTSDVYWDRIRSIAADGVEDVFDMTVDELHNFVADNIILHNSIEQDADLVMFLFRPEYYKSDEKPGVAEVHVAKHRNGPTGTIELKFRRDHTRFYNLETRRPEPGTE